jgi:hypothetical protein
MADKKIFVSYDYDNDKHYRYLLSAWDANKSFAFTFEDHSTPYINSEDAARIKAAISSKLKNADCLLVIIGEKTATSGWVAWEIERAQELELRLIGVKVDDQYASPAGLLGVGASWAMSFTESAIAAAVAKC